MSDKVWKTILQNSRSSEMLQAPVQSLVQSLPNEARFKRQIIHPRMFGREQSATIVDVLSLSFLNSSTE